MKLPFSYWICQADACTQCVGCVRASFGCSGTCPRSVLGAVGLGRLGCAGWDAALQGTRAAAVLPPAPEPPEQEQRGDTQARSHRGRGAAGLAAAGAAFPKRGSAVRRQGRSVNRNLDFCLVVWLQKTSPHPLNKTSLWHARGVQSPRLSPVLYFEHF